MRSIGGGRLRHAQHPAHSPHVRPAPACRGEAATDTEHGQEPGSEAGNVARALFDRPEVLIDLLGHLDRREHAAVGRGRRNRHQALSPAHVELGGELQLVRERLGRDPRLSGERGGVGTRAMGRQGGGRRGGEEGRGRGGETAAKTAGLRLEGERAQASVLRKRGETSRVQRRRGRRAVRRTHVLVGPDDLAHPGGVDVQLALAISHAIGRHLRADEAGAPSW